MKRMQFGFSFRGTSHIVGRSPRLLKTLFEREFEGPGWPLKNRDPGMFDCSLREVFADCA
jgi:hypothetical protein